MRVLSVLFCFCKCGVVRVFSFFFFGCKCGGGVVVVGGLSMWFQEFCVLLNML